MTRLHGSLGLAALALVAGCASHPQHSSSPFRDRAPQVRPIAMELRVEVLNEHWLPIRVWAEWPQISHFLGDVSPGGISVFSFPGTLVEQHGDVRLLAAPSGSADQVLTEPIECHRGRRIVFTVRKLMANSRTRVM
jgi:hypothetical protein